MAKEALVVVLEGIKQFGTNLFHSPKTSAAGISATAVGIAAFIEDPMKFLTNPDELAVFLVGLGLLFAADQNGAKVK